MRASYGTVFRVPRQEPGAMATCAYCEFSRFYPNNRHTRGAATSRAKRALYEHFKRAHPDKGLQLWVPGKE